VARGDARTDAILDATLELMASTGYDRLTIDAVASRAGASKATIYRRWPGKSELVMAALSRHSAAAIAEVDTGSLRSDLIQTVSQMRDSLASQDGVLILGVLNAMRGNAELAELVRSHVLGAKRTTSWHPRLLPHSCSPESSSPVRHSTTLRSCTSSMPC
jgi:AcrR family transcriptional regulator